MCSLCENTGDGGTPVLLSLEHPHQGHAHCMSPECSCQVHVDHELYMVRAVRAPRHEPSSHGLLTQNCPEPSKRVKCVVNP